MAKTCPSCGYAPIGPFTDNCPICAEPVRNVRSNPVGSSGPTHWLRWVVSVAAVALLGVSGCCGLGMWRMGSAISDAQKMMDKAKADFEADRKARTVVITAADLLKEFQDDPAAADRKFKGKYLELTGIVERTGKGASGLPFAILHAGDDQAPIKIECFFDYIDDDTRDERLAKGQTVTLGGEYNGRVSHAQIRSCVLVK